MDVACSGNIIKNVKSVTVPNSGGMHGIEAAAVLGAVGGDAKSALEVLESVNDEDRARVAELLADAGYCDVSLVEGVPNLYIKVTATAGGIPRSSRLPITTLMSRAIRSTVFRYAASRRGSAPPAPSAWWPSVRQITPIRPCPLIPSSTLSRTVTLRAPRAVERQIELNGAISAEGLAHAWGAEVGRTLLGARADERRLPCPCPCRPPGPTPA